MTRLSSFGLLFIAISFFSCKQNKATPNLNSKQNTDSTKYVQKSIEFIKQVEKQEIEDSTFILVDKAFPLDSSQCWKELLADTLTFSKAELSFLRLKKYPSISYWRSGLFPVIKFISRDTLNAIFKKSPINGWSYFNQEYGPCFNSFSWPIFLRSYTYCLFYSEFSCGLLNGAGTLMLYKLINTKWQYVKSYCDWIS